MPFTEKTVRESLAESLPGLERDLVDLGLPIEMCTRIADIAVDFLCEALPPVLEKFGEESARALVKGLEQGLGRRL